MYRLTKEFKFSMGHRLSKHQGLCKNIHGHNYRIIVAVKSIELNSDGMVIDFGNLKAIVEGFLDAMDHALMVNEDDKQFIKKITEVMPEMRIIETGFEPTAENMSREIFSQIGRTLARMYPQVHMDYVTVYETDGSAATYDHGG